MYSVILAGTRNLHMSLSSSSIVFEASRNSCSIPPSWTIQIASVACSTLWYKVARKPPSRVVYVVLGAGGWGGINGSASMLRGSCCCCPLLFLSLNSVNLILSLLRWLGDFFVLFFLSLATYNYSLGIMQHMRICFTHDSQEIKTSY